MNEIMIFAGVLAILTVAFVQLIKKTTQVPSKLMPLISLAIGIIVGAIAYFVPELTSDLSIGAHLIAGALSGLSASGLFDLATKTNEGFRKAG